MRVGILAIHGSVAEHANVLHKLKITPVKVRAKKDFKCLDGFILPGGESTTINDLADVYGLKKEIINFAINKKSKTVFDCSELSTPPIFGTCAGIILLARLGLLDIEVDRNAYGKQINSFETKINVILQTQVDSNFKTVPAVFIRAPRIIKTGRDVNVLARFKKDPILVQQNNIYGATFHPELTSNMWIHRLIFGQH